MITRRAFLGGVLATGLVSTVPMSTSEAASSGRLPGWMPPTQKQSGPVCTVAATTQAMHYLMANQYGWQHALTWPRVDLLARAEERPETRRQHRVLADANKLGYRTSQHPNTLLRPGWREIERTPEAIKSALALKQPVLLNFWQPTAWGKYNDGLPTALGRGVSAHAVLACGWSAYGIWFQNSYGSSWGNAGGYGWLSWDWYAANSLYGAWAITSIRVN